MGRGELGAKREASDKRRMERESGGAECLLSLSAQRFSNNNVASLFCFTLNRFVE